MLDFLQLPNFRWGERQPIHHRCEAAKQLLILERSEWSDFVCIDRNQKKPLDLFSDDQKATFVMWASGVPDSLNGSANSTYFFGIPVCDDAFLIGDSDNKPPTTRWLKDSVHPTIAMYDFRLHQLWVRCWQEFKAWTQAFQQSLGKSLGEPWTARLQAVNQGGKPVRMSHKISFWMRCLRPKMPIVPVWDIYYRIFQDFLFKAWLHELSSDASLQVRMGGCCRGSHEEELTEAAACRPILHLMKRPLISGKLHWRHSTHWWVCWWCFQM